MAELRAGDEVEVVRDYAGSVLIDGRWYQEMIEAGRRARVVRAARGPFKGVMIVRIEYVDAPHYQVGLPVEHVRPVGRWRQLRLGLGGWGDAAGNRR